MRASTHGSKRRQRQLVAAVRRKKWHKSLAGTRRWISPRVHPRGRGIIKFRPAMRGAATLRSCTLSRPFCLPRGWDLVEGYYRAHPGLCRGCPDGVRYSPRVIQSFDYPAAAKQSRATWHEWRDAPLMPYREETLLCIVKQILHIHKSILSFARQIVEERNLTYALFFQLNLSVYVLCSFFSRELSNFLSLSQKYPLCALKYNIQFNNSLSFWEVPSRLKLNMT